jgi:hypothetical protein
MKIHFAVSEAQYEPHEKTGEPPISPNQAALMTVEVGIEPVQMTYNQLRTGPHGDTIAIYDESSGFWEIVVELETDSMTDQYGKPVEQNTKGMEFTDWSVTS